MLVGHLLEGKDVFVRRVVWLMRYVAADPDLNMYYCYAEYLSRMVFDVEAVPGFTLVLDGLRCPYSCTR